MIGPDKNINIGGVVQLDLVPLSKAVNLREKNMKCVLFIEEGFTSVPVYRTYKSDRAQTNLNKSSAGTSYPNEIRWLIPQDRLELWESILPYLNQYVLIIATLNDGNKKIYGTPDCPLLLTANSTPLTTPDSFNGVEILCSGLDILPGRFLYNIVEYVEPVPEVDWRNFDNLDGWDINHSPVNNDPEFLFEECENSICTLRIEVNEESQTAITISHMFDTPKTLTQVRLLVTEMSAVNWLESSNRVFFVGYIDTPEGDGHVFANITSTGLKTYDISSTLIYGVRISLRNYLNSIPLQVKFDWLDFVEV